MAETNGLLNRRRGITSTEGSNPSLSARIIKPRLQLINAVFRGLLFLTCNEIIPLYDRRNLLFPLANP